jgi:hypothetical protein
MFPNTQERYGGWEFLNGTRINSCEIRVQSESNMHKPRKMAINTN